jgi:hypothetical protein
VLVLTHGVEGGGGLAAGQLGHELGQALRSAFGFGQPWGRRSTAHQQLLLQAGVQWDDAPDAKGDQAQ